MNNSIGVAMYDNGFRFYEIHDSKPKVGGQFMGGEVFAIENHTRLVYSKDKDASRDHNYYKVLYKDSIGLIPWCRYIAVMKRSRNK